MISCHLAAALPLSQSFFNFLVAVWALDLAAMWCANAVGKDAGL